MEPYRHRRRVGFGECDPARIFFAPRAIEYSVEAAEAYCEAVLGLSWAGLVAEQERKGSPLAPGASRGRGAGERGREVRVLSFDCAYERSIAASQEVELVVEAARPSTSSERTESGTEVHDLRVVAEVAPGTVSFRTALRLAIVARGAPDPSARLEAPDLSARPELVEGRAPIPGAFTRVHRVRYGDCAPSGDVYAPRVAEWAVEAVGEWYEATVGVSWIEQCRRGRGTPFLRIACPRLARITAGTRVAMEITIPKLGKASIGYRVVGRGDGGEPLFEADMAACYISEEAGPPRSMPFPDAHRERIRAYLAATGTGS